LENFQSDKMIKVPEKETFENNNGVIYINDWYIFLEQTIKKWLKLFIWICKRKIYMKRGYMMLLHNDKAIQALKILADSGMFEM
jgi:hypothetical protein